MNEQAERHEAGPLRAVDKAAEFQRLAELQLVQSYRLAHVILGDHTDAEDAVHDAFLTACASGQRSVNRPASKPGSSASW